LHGGDLSRIDRTIVREPSYQGQPKYCLVVFGPECKKRVWLVVDGYTLYVDRNGNADLTEPGERVEGRTAVYKDTQAVSPRPVGVNFEVDGVARWDRMDVTLRVSRSTASGWYDSVHALDLVESLAMTTPDRSEGLRFSDRPQDAPVVHFNGPLRMAPLGDQTLNRNDDSQLAQTMIGTPGIGPGTFTALNIRMVPKDLHPVAEIEFPVKEGGGEPLRAKVILAQRC
jgi:hypothetical protein